MNWYIQAFQKYAEFNGRARRSEYWYFTLFNLLITLLLLFIDSEIGSYGILTIGYYLATIIPSLAVCVRRLHDTNHSGWSLLIGLVPVIGSIVLLVFFISDSYAGENQYGLSPK